MKTNFNEERRTKNEKPGFAPTARANPRLPQVLPNVSAAFLKCILAFFVLNSSFFVPAARAGTADEYATIKAQLELLKQYKTAESYADLRIWYLRNTKPKIFLEIETASNATDMGYFRQDFNAAGKLGRYKMLRDEFGIK